MPRRHGNGETKGRDLGSTVEEHALVVVVVVLVCDLLLPVGVALPQLLVHHFLDLRGTITFTTH